MGSVVIPIVVIVVILVIAWVGFRRWGAERNRISDELNEPTNPSLDYRVPTGQDPAVVLAALNADGYVAATDTTDSQLVRVACPAGPDRERARVRAVIENAGGTALEHGAPVPGPVRFEDEH